MRLLLVEDDPGLSATLARGLREQAYAVDVAADGESALYLAATSPYDALVLDINLPRRDGLSVCRELRRRGSPVRILMLTARGRPGDRVEGLDTGADDYLAKPFDFEELLARLRALLRRRGEQVDAPYLSVADLQIDLIGQTAARAGVPIELTTKEFTLIAYLARHPGKVIGRAELTEHVWDENHDPASNTLEVYINRLRRKIDRPGLAPLIHTRRGAGYSLGPRRAP
jgi:two-component system copper resistance phosphate regulon response regulator CusR